MCAASAFISFDTLPPRMYSLRVTAGHSLRVIDKLIFSIHILRRVQIEQVSARKKTCWKKNKKNNKKNYKKEEQQLAAAATGECKSGLLFLFFECQAAGMWCGVR